METEKMWHLKTRKTCLSSNNHHLDLLTARIPSTISRHSSLSVIVPLLIAMAKMPLYDFLRNLHISKKR